MRRYRKIKYTEHDRERQIKSDRQARNDERSPFERDRSRIIHSAAFRRLQGKTQVFTTGEGDFFRTRLTHSLEVAQVGKGLALRLGADTDIVETISLLHDIGHPPFGHAGEDELKRLMTPYGGFEANAQNIRIFTKLESKSPDYEGLNLTRAVIDGQLKYKRAFPEDKRKFIYQADVDLVEWASKEARCSVSDLTKDCKSFECEIMDWADEVAYAVHDLEDSLHAGYINAYTFRPDNPRIRESIGAVEKKFPNCKSRVFGIYEDLFEVLVHQNPDFQVLGSFSDYKETKINRKRLTSFLINRYILAADRSQRQGAVSKPISYRYLYQVEIPIKYKIEVALINAIIMNVVIKSPQVSTLEEKGKLILKSLFSAFMDDNKTYKLLPDDWKGYLKEDDSPEARARVVCDYLAGMTDNYAQKLYARLFLPHQGSIYDVI